MKQQLRKEFRELERKRDGTLMKSIADIAIRDSLRGLEPLKTAKCVAGYVPIDGEVDLTPFLAILAENGVRVCLPRSNNVKAGLPRDNRVKAGTPRLSNASANEVAPRNSRTVAKEIAYVMAEISLGALSNSVRGNVMIEGAFGISEPPLTAKVVPNSEVDVWLIPALAFDERGVRLGRGGGFYDRFLAESAGVRIGVGYDSMILKQLPCDEWDQSMDLIVTERRLLWM